MWDGAPYWPAAITLGASLVLATAPTTISDVVYL